MTSPGRRGLPWLPVVGVIGLWLAVVGREVPYFYGEFGDDYGVFLGGLATLGDWREAFGGWHVSAFYFLVIAYLPLKLHLALPGAVLPDFSHENIALYRGLIAYTVLLHAVILGLYAWFVYQVTRRHLLTLLATLLLATNPFFLAMATTPDSRIIGLLFALPGMTLAMTLDWRTARLTRSTLLKLYLAGVLLTMSYLAHYSALYLVAPFIAAYWTIWLLRSDRRATLLRGAALFAVGLLTPQLLVECVLGFVLRLPNTLTNLAGLTSANAVLYGNTLTYGQKAQEWAAAYAADYGWPILACALAGLLLVSGSAWLRRRYLSVTQGWILALTVGCGILLPFAAIFVPYRGQSAIQPLVILLAAIGLTAVYDAAIAAGCRAARGATPLQRRWRAVGPGVIRVGIGLVWLLVLWIPLQASVQQVLPARTALGRSLEQAPQPMMFPLYAGNLVSQDFFDQQGIGISPAQVLDMPPEVFVRDCAYPTCAYLPDRARFLRVDAVTADSTLQASAGRYDPARALDGGMSHDGITEWRSDPSEGLHWLALQFAEPYALDKLVIANRRQGVRADALDVWGLVNGEWAHLYRGADLSKSAVVHARWPQITVTGLRVEIAASTLEGQRSAQAEIDELYFPGYRVLLSAVGARPALAPLPILAVDADSTHYDTWSRWSPAHVFQHQIPRADSYSAWQSEHTATPHALTVQFATSQWLDNVQVSNPVQAQLINAFATRIDEMEVWLYGDSGWARVWAGRELSDQIVVRASWPAMPASAAAIVVRRSLLNGRPADYTVIQEIVFPGYFAVFDWPRP